MRLQKNTLRLLTPVVCLAATATAQTYKAQKVAFSTLGGFTQRQMEEAAQLRPGSAFTTDQLTAAAQRLSDSGYFEEVGASFNGATVLFTLKAADRASFLPVRFSNFVWLSPAEIEAAIHKSFPLFNDSLPEASPHQEEIEASLVTALATKSITAKVGYEAFQPTLAHPRREISFYISQPAVTIANIKLAGVTPELVPLLQKSVNATARTLYTEGPAEQTTADRILAPLLDAGYIQATLANVAPAPAPVDGGKAPVVVTATLKPGEIFHLASITFTGSPLLSAADFAASAKLHPGDVASHKALLETLAPLDAAYRRKGFMDVAIDAEPNFDATNHQVAYTVTVTPGEPYQVHTITTENLDPAAQADFDRYFQMKTGALFNPEYITGFIKSNTALRSFQGYVASYRAFAYPATHTVDVNIVFVKPIVR